MPYIVMYSTKPNAKTYEAVVAAGGGEIQNAVLYGRSGQARQVAGAHSREDDGYSYLVLPVLVGTRRVHCPVNHDVKS